MARKSTTQTTLEQANAQILKLTREIAIKKARNDQIEFVKLLMPDPNGIKDGNPLASRFDDTPFHHYLVKHTTEAILGKGNHKALTTPPQHGKTTLTGETLIPWAIGRVPTLNIIFASYSEDRAREVGGIVKGHVESDVFKEVFPGVELRPDAKSSEQMVTSNGGRIAFIGRKGAGSGKPCDLLIIDDPIKNAEEARSAAVLKELHDWYDSVADTRCHKRTRRLVIHTRWVVDDLIGVLCDPEHPDYDPVLARRWDYINIPAVLTDTALAAEIGIELKLPHDWGLTGPDLELVIEQFGCVPMSTLWPDRFDLVEMAMRRRKNKKVFTALSMGKPSPEDGDQFTKDMIVPYTSATQLPKGMLIYGASDHAISDKREADFACLGCFGVDGDNNIWVLPDLVWDKVGAMLANRIVDQMEVHRPLVWFGEQDLIGATLGPSIRKLMDERRIYCYMEGVPTRGGDKTAKAANARARMALGKIRLPSFAPWYDRAVAELIKFPSGRHDDFVDFLSILSRGLDIIHGGRVGKIAEPEKKYEPDTIGYLMQQARREDARKKAASEIS